jgi:hypothetical protein
MNTRIKVAGTIAALAVCIVTAPAMEANAAVTPHDEAAFCTALARFGDTPSYANLTRVHELSAHVDAGMRGDYGRYQSALLAGRPASDLRKRLDAVYADCSPHAAVKPPVMHAPHVVSSPLRRLMGDCAHSRSIGIDHSVYMCVQQAPRDACRAALGVKSCWWYTGTKSQVVFDAAGFAVTS